MTDVPFVIALSDNHNRIPLFCIQLIRALSLKVELDYRVQPARSALPSTMLHSVRACTHG